MAKQMAFAGGKATAPARFFDQVFVEGGHVARLGKKGLIGVSSKTLNRLISNPKIPENLERLLLGIYKGKKLNFTEDGLLAEINSITKVLSRTRFSADEFSFLEDLRVSLINHLREKFGKDIPRK
jgi:hypothetical protein